MSVAAKKLNWDDIKDWSEYQGRTEIVEGELVVSPVPSLDHQIICTRLGVAILPFVKERNSGEFFMLPVHVILSEHVHYEPDLCFILDARLGICKESYLQGPPDLIIEVISESNRTHETVVKFRDYQQYGVREYWLVDPRAQHIRTFSLESGRYSPLGVFGRGDRVETRVLAGLELDPAQAL